MDLTSFAIALAVRKSAFVPTDQVADKK